MIRSLGVTACSLLFLAAAVAQDAARDAVEVGKAAPDFTMTGIDGNDFKLSDLRAKGKNVALMFDRANW